MSTAIHFISAGAGSGKTYRLTQKLNDLLSQQAVSPAGVIATTFTKLAAGELQERVRGALIDAGQLVVANEMEQALIGTVNSVCGEILRRFAFEAGIPPDQQVIDEDQGDILFYRAMEQALTGNKSTIRKMNILAQRLQIADTQTKQQLWRQEVKKIVDTARANNQSPDTIRALGKSSADSLLAYFPPAIDRKFDDELLGAVNHALAAIDTEYDKTQDTSKFVSLLTGARAALIHRRLTWPEWISLSKGKVGAKSRDHVAPLIDIATQFASHPQLHKDLRDFTELAFAIAADSLIAYQEMKRQKGLIDFVDQEQRLYQLLDNPTVATTLGEELELLMVDEFQDTSPIQLALFLKLSRLADRVIWVGDIKQSIYGFRGSDPSLMDAVLRRVIEQGNAPEILGDSWRSTPELVAYANNLFVPAFSDTLGAEQVELNPQRAPLPEQPAVETWRLQGGRKDVRARALAGGITSLLDSGRQAIDKHCNQPRPLRYGDIAILCRNHDNLGEIANALADAKLPIRYKRPGLLSTPECCLALACLRRLVDPLDNLASAEIHSLSTCENPEAWISQRLAYIEAPEKPAHSWLEDMQGPLANLKALRSRMPYLTPVEALRTAIDAAGVRESITRWGPTPQRTQHRLNNLAALLNHAQDYLDQCKAQSEPATTAGLILWLRALADAEEDTQASGGNEDAIQLVTHHGAKGLEWPIVVAMDLCTELKPRLWGLTVLPSPSPIDLDDPLANRTLRYWPRFFGNHSTKVEVLDTITESQDGQNALEQEVQESKRLLYVSLTRARDGLILCMDNKRASGPWMDTLQAGWMLPDGDSLILPDGRAIPCRAIELVETNNVTAAPPYQPFWPEFPGLPDTLLSLRKNPSSVAPVESASIGEIITLGDRIEVNGSYDPATLGSALHAVIATTIMGQQATSRILLDYGVHEVISIEAADTCCRRLIEALDDNFSPTAFYTEYPLTYTTPSGQVVTGWIDLLVETEEGLIVIDHKASPRGRSEWEEIALSYSGQLDAYVEGLRTCSSKPVISKWIHFAVSGGLVSVI
ncbi:UvrD-helicase domain-containing protein [Mangrovimicrobium sediminis]|uniref:UvrD-helicase domain-containing protein n=1 Tax=Mangrovimicrobium sediminis TaxID=2562682 RepID=UPI001436C887|nr:UvrD-helicase domain-containing protein [Haliea sp. SAOS-164]